MIPVSAASGPSSFPWPQGAEALYIVCSCDERDDKDYHVQSRTRRRLLRSNTKMIQQPCAGQAEFSFNFQVMSTGMTVMLNIQVGKSQ